MPSGWLLLAGPVAEEENLQAQRQGGSPGLGGAEREVGYKMRQWGLEVIRSREDTGFHISLVSVCTGEVFGLG